MSDIARENGGEEERFGLPDNCQTFAVRMQNPQSMLVSLVKPYNCIEIDEYSGIDR